MNEQFYEYCCCHSIVAIFAVLTANRTFIYADVGRPGILEDSTIHEWSMSKSNINTGKWLGAAIPDLVLSNIPFRLYLADPSALAQNVTMIKKNCQFSTPGCQPAAVTAG